MTRSYSYYRELFRGLPMPFAYVDMDLLNANIQQLLTQTEGKPIRVASRAIRSPHLLRYILNSDPHFQAVLCYSAREALWLSELGFDDLLIGYPSMHQADIEKVCEKVKAGKQITFMVDAPGHVHRLNKIAAQFDMRIPICLDMDTSMRFLGKHFGTHHSSIRNTNHVLKLVAELQPLRHLKVVGLRAYEDQLANIGDAYKGKWLRNTWTKYKRKRNAQKLERKRAAVVNIMSDGNYAPRFVSAGGTGCIEESIIDGTVTELTIGSAFYAPALYDHFSKLSLLPAMGYAIEIVRQPRKNIYTCMGGGYNASGKMSADKLPCVYLPEGASLTKSEGAGEVQTPIVYKGYEQLALGDPIFLRHSKAGELCEHFNDIYLVSEGKILEKVKTYRGEGKCFL